MSKSPDGIFDLFIYEKRHDYDQQNTHNNVHPHISVKEQDGNFDSGHKEYSQQIKVKGQFI